MTGVSGSCHGKSSVTSGHMVTVGVSDNGKSFCVKPGAGILVVLRGTPTRKWTPIHTSSSVLAPRANGHLALQMGATGGYFVATHAGTAVISSGRPACASHPSGGSSSPSPGGVMSCDSQLAFHATVTVQS